MNKRDQIQWLTDEFKRVLDRAINTSSFTSSITPTASAMVITMPSLMMMMTKNDFFRPAIGI